MIWQFQKLNWLYISVVEKKKKKQIQVLVIIDVVGMTNRNRLFGLSNLVLTT